MSNSSAARRVAKCEGCGLMPNLDSQLLLEAGWTLSDGVALCPHCRPSLVVRKSPSPRGPGPLSEYVAAVTRILSDHLEGSANASVNVAATERFRRSIHFIQKCNNDGLAPDECASAYLASDVPRAG